MSRRVVVFAAALAQAVTFAATGALAAPAQPPSSAPAVQAVMDCRKITDNSQRLACFDAAAANLSQAEASGDLVSLDRNQRREVRRQAFGLTLPSIALFDRGEGELDSVKETLASARQGAEGRWVFVMQDGEVWRQIDDEFLSRKPHEGSAVEIRRAMLGSFMLSVDGQPGVRAHRDN